MTSIQDQLDELVNLPQINEVNLNRLKKSTASNPQLLKDIFQSFIDESKELIGEIRAGIEKNDHVLYYNAVHSLKGLSATIGCTRLFHLLKIMDSLNKENQYSESQRCYKHLEVMFSEAESIIRDTILN
ncbi:MAG: Hpt domain-containing protein [Bacteroidales bacterium]|nr:Hpt domain-containing protein [Bacteroidales bacterium]